MTVFEAREAGEELHAGADGAPSPAAEIFLGRFRPELFLPFPDEDPETRRAGEAFVRRLEEYLRREVDADEIDRSGEMPTRVLRGLAEVGAWGMRIPPEFGGLGLSQRAYGRAIGAAAAHSGALAVWLSAHQSIGAPQPLLAFGTPDQQRRYLPALAAGSISAFALTEPDVGSDPARVAATATPSEDGHHYLLNGEKLWCTNGPDADLVVVLARTPPRADDPAGRRTLSAFLVETKSRGFFGSHPVDGLEIARRCSFMGLRGISNGLLRLRNVRVHRTNLIGEEGRGLRVAFGALDVGRLTMAAGCAGVGRACLRWARRWARERVQGGAPIGRHEAVAARLAGMASDLFAAEALADFCAARLDGGEDVRLEAAAAKIFAAEASMRIADSAVQIRGGRGYETADSLRRRGEPPIPIERAFRDSRIQTIVGGSGETLRLFLARQALGPHLRAAGDLVVPGRTPAARAAAALRTASFYAGWYPTTFLPGAPAPEGPLDHHLDFVSVQARRLGRALFHAAALHGAAVERRQSALFRLVDAGVDLLATAACVARARAALEANPADRTPEALADLFCRGARRRVRAALGGDAGRDDRAATEVGRDLLDGRYEWLEAGAPEA